MRARIILVVVATTSLVLVAFLLPLALLVRAAAEDRAVNSAVVQAQALVPIVTTTDGTDLGPTLARVNAAGNNRITVFLPDGRMMGAPAPRSAAVDLAAEGRSVTADAPGGREVLVAVAGLADGTAVIRAFVPNADLHQGVALAWWELGALGIGLLLVSVLVADQLGRTITRPLKAVAAVSHQLAQGALDSRADDDGPPEVRQVSAGLNLLASRIGELLAQEREAVADLSHRLRTPLTALRIDVDAVDNPLDRVRLSADVDAVERMINNVIREARRPVREGLAADCDAAQVVADRVAFWSALAEEEQRPLAADLSPGPIPVRLTADDLAACVDALLANVFAHTPEGCGFGVRLDRGPGGGGRLVVWDTGPGLPEPVELARGRSTAGSTGLGLDIVRRTATASGGSVSLGQSPGGGALISLDLGAAARSGSVPRQRHRAKP